MESSEIYIQLSTKSRKASYCSNTTRRESISGRLRKSIISRFKLPYSTLDKKVIRKNFKKKVPLSFTHYNKNRLRALRAKEKIQPERLLSEDVQKKLALQEVQTILPQVSSWQIQRAKKIQEEIYALQLLEYNDWLNNKCTDEELGESDGGYSEGDTTGQEDIINSTTSEEDLE